MGAYPLYPNALRSIVNILEGLDAIDDPKNDKRLTGGDDAVQLKTGLEVINADDDVVIGYVKDDLGGAWHFEPSPSP